MYTLLVIKGGLDVATAAVAARGLNPVKSSVQHSEFTLSESHIVVEDADHAVLGKWLCEMPNEAPFPEGALLWYTDWKDEV